MTFQEFRSVWNGKFCEAGGSPGAKNQCVDLVNQYLSDVLGKPKILGTNAVDFPKKIGPEFEFIQKTDNTRPIQGDILIWGKPFGEYFIKGVRHYAGHIAVCIDGHENHLTSFDQNYPTGSPCSVVEHGYTGIIGWIRLKGSMPEKKYTEEEMTTVRLQRDSNWNLYQESKGKLESLAIYVTEIEEVLGLAQSNADLPQRLQSIVSAVKLFQKPPVELQPNVPSPVQPVQENTDKPEEKEPVSPPSTPKVSLLDMIINFLQGLKG